MSERMWLTEQLEKARTERDQARLDLAAKDAEITRLREENEVLKLRAGICYSGADLAAIREQTLDECEAIAVQMATHPDPIWSHAASLIAGGITALKDAK